MNTKINFSLIFILLFFPQTAIPNRYSVGKTRVPRRIYRGEGMGRQQTRDTNRAQHYRKELYSPPIHPNCFWVWIDNNRL